MATRRDSNPDDGVDRAAILHRRSLFIVSAVSGLATATFAHAQVPPEPAPNCPPKDPTPQDRAAAIEHFEHGTEAASIGAFADAATSFGESYKLIPADRVLIAWMNALFRNGAPEAAAQAAATHVQCGGSLDKIQATLDEIQAKSARVVVSITGPGAEQGTILLDEQPIDLARARLGVLASAGPHIITFRNTEGAVVMKTIQAVAGESSTVDIAAPPLAPPRVCLNFVRTKVADRIRLEAGVIAPFFSVAPSDPASVLAGAGARVAIGARLEESGRKTLWFEGDLFGAFAGDANVRLVMVGGVGELRFHFDETPYGFGLGFGGGYLFDVTSESAPADWYVSSPFFGPVATPVSVRFGPLEMELRIPCWFGQTSSEGVIAIRPVMVAPYATFTLGGGVGSTGGNDY